MERKFHVQVTPWYTQLEITLTNLPQEEGVVRFGSVKEAAARCLKLNPISFPLFGLFELPPESGPFIPVKLYSDHDITEDRDYLFLGLLRLSFDEYKIEDQLLFFDKLATQLFCHEAKSMYEDGTIIGSLKDIAVALYERFTVCGGMRQKPRKNMPKLVQHFVVPPGEEKYLELFDANKQTLEDNIVICLSGEYRVNLHTVEKFLHAMHCLDFYWTYFYKVMDCTLCGDTATLLSTYLNLNERRKVDVILNKASLSFLGVTTAKQYLHLIDFPWVCIHSVIMNPAEKTFSFQVLLQEKKRLCANACTISIWTERYEYLYSMAIHILQLHEAELARVDFEYPHILTKDDCCILNSIRPTSVDLDDFLVIILPLYFLKYITEQKNVSLKFLQALEIPKLPTIKFASPQVAYINRNFYHASFRLKEIPSSSISLKDAGYFKIVQDEDVTTMPFCSSDRAAKIASCSRVQLPLNVFSRTVTIQTFHGAFKVPIYCCSMTFLSFKKLAMRILRLNRNSIDAFTLFSHHKRFSLRSSHMYYDVAEFPNDITHLVLRRNAFYKEIEFCALKFDFAALNLLYREAIYSLENDLVNPKICNDEATKYLRKNLNSDDRETMLRFIRYISTTSIYWWYQYHRVECTFPNIKDLYKEYFVPEDVRMAAITIGVTYFSALGDPGNLSIKFPLDTVCSVIQDSSGATIIEILFIAQNKDQEYLKILYPLVCVNKIYQDFLYHMMAYVIMILVPRQKNEDEIINREFGPTVEKGQIASICMSQSFSSTSVTVET